ncbi:hypothetical protein Tco_1499064 [Tanacetum coccineum]
MLYYHLSGCNGLARREPGPEEREAYIADRAEFMKLGTSRFLVIGFATLLTQTPYVPKELEPGKTELATSDETAGVEELRTPLLQQWPWLSDLRTLTCSR